MKFLSITVQIVLFFNLLYQITIQAIKTLGILNSYVGIIIRLIAFMSAYDVMNLGGENRLLTAAGGGAQ